MQRVPNYDVSLIVPIYNVREYLLDCLSSISRQTVFSRIEVILIDDGSTDGSGEIAAEFAELHQNVRLITQSNRGQGAARNRGLAEATARYIAFVDSDDILPEDSIQVRMSAMTAEVSLVVGDMQTFPVTTRWPWSKGISAGNRVLADILDFPELITNASPCNKLFRAEFFETHQFEEDRHFEDAFVVVPGLLVSTQIAIVADVVYFYRKRAAGDSTMDGLFKRPDNYWDHLALAERVRAKSNELTPELSGVARLYNIRTMQGFVLRAPDILHGEDLHNFYERARAVFDNIHPDEVRDATHNLHHRIAFAALMLGDEALFNDRWSAPTTLCRVGGMTTLAISDDTPEDMVSMLEVVAPRLLVEHASVTRGKVFVSGRLELPGVPAAGLQETVRVRLASLGKAVTTLEGVRVRRAATTSRPTTVLEWRSEVKTEASKNGHYLLDAHVVTERGQFTIRARAAVGLQRSTRTLRVRGHRMLFIPEAQDRLSMLRQRRVPRLNRLLWSVRLMADDLRLVVKRRPLAWTRVLRFWTKPVSWGRPIWLIGERPDTTQDNGFRLFSWLRASDVEIRARYVLDKKSDAWRSMRNRRHVLARGSIRHRLAVLHARALISSHDIDSYMLPPTWRPADFRRFVSYRLEQDRVFLQHGVTFKDVAAPLAREVIGVRLFVASIEEERRYLTDYGHYDNEVVLTGMPRFDTLTRTPKADVVLMPTWRKYLVLPSYVAGGVDPGTFNGSEYQRFYSALLTSPRLIDTLERHGQSMTFMPHYEVAHSFQFGDLSPRIRVVPPDGDVQERIKSASVLISDYSSVMFDAVYAGVPVVQVPFDLEEHSARHYGEGWLDNGRGEYWPVARTVDDAIDALDRILSAGAVVSSEYQKKIERLFPRRDQENSRRVYEAIRSLR